MDIMDFKRLLILKHKDKTGEVLKMEIMNSIKYIKFNIEQRESRTDIVFIISHLIHVIN